jgi:hypothetical protein
MALHKEKISMEEAGIRYLSAVSLGMSSVDLPPGLCQMYLNWRVRAVPNRVWDLYVRDPFEAGTRPQGRLLRSEDYNAMCVERYGGTLGDWDALWTLVQHWGPGKRLVHPLCLAMAHVDYG